MEHENHLLREENQMLRKVNNRFMSLLQIYQGHAQDEKDLLIQPQMVTPTYAPSHPQRVAPVVAKVVPTQPYPSKAKFYLHPDVVRYLLPHVPRSMSELTEQNLKTYTDEAQKIQPDVTTSKVRQYMTNRIKYRNTLERKAAKQSPPMPETIEKPIVSEV